MSSVISWIILTENLMETDLIKPQKDGKAKNSGFKA